MCKFVGLNMNKIEKCSKCDPRCESNNSSLGKDETFFSPLSSTSQCCDVTFKEPASVLCDIFPNWLSVFDCWNEGFATSSRTH
jgi:hypothetical protein